MPTVRDIYTFMNIKAPFPWQMSYDNAGFLVGYRNAPVERVLVALDITPEVVMEGAARDVQLILAHHPVIWKGAKSITDETTTGRVVMSMVEKGIAAICAHTNLDMAWGGVNDALAYKLGLEDPCILTLMGRDEDGWPYGIGRIGTVQSQSLETFAAAVKERLGCQALRVVDGGQPVQRVAVGGGSCGDMLPDAIAMFCDTFVTSDVKYDVFLEAKAQGINLIDAGHFPTENVICPVLAEWLEADFPDLKVFISETHREVYSFF